MIARHAYVGEQRFNELTDKLMSKPRHSNQPGLTDAEADEHRLAHYAGLYGWATASLLGFIEHKFGAEAAYRAAAMVQDMGANGGAPFCEDFPYPPTAVDAAKGARP
jgi:hypothetical protein